MRANTVSRFTRACHKTAPRRNPRTIPVDHAKTKCAWLAASASDLAQILSLAKAATARPNSRWPFTVP